MSITTTNAQAQTAAPGAAAREKITVRNLDFYYGANRALKGVSIPFEENAVTALIGPSGCGKSTLLRLASRLTQPTSGAIHIPDGNLGYVFQDATLLPWRTVQGNVELLTELAPPKP